MSLRWDTTKIEGWKGSEYQETDMFVVTECIVHRMMHTGLGWELTESNAAEFYARCKFADKFGGELLIIDGKRHEITPKMIRDHIGLTVNVSPETRKSFINRYVQMDWDRWEHEYESAVKETAA